MKWIFLFLLLLPSVSALAVMPTSINLGELQRGDIIEREFQIVNTLDENVDVYINSDKQWISSEDKIKLKDKEKISITIIPNEEDGIYDGNIFITEVIDNDSPFGIVNTIAIPYSLTIKGGRDVVENLDIPKITGKTSGVKIGDNSKWVGLVVLIIVIIFGGILLIKSFK